MGSQRLVEAETEIALGVLVAGLSSRSEPTHRSPKVSLHADTVSKAHRQVVLSDFVPTQGRSPIQRIASRVFFGVPRPKS